VWVTPALSARVQAAEIFRDVRGWRQASDHAPVLVRLK
jgi:exonuclease III